MVFSKALFLKGLAGVATVGTAALGWGFREQIFGKKEVKEDDLGIPTSCKADQATGTTTQTCELTKEQFEKIKFEKENDSSAISIEGLTENGTVTLTVTAVADDTANYPKGKKYALTLKTGTVTIKGIKGGSISLTNSGVDFREKEGNILEKVTVVQSQAPATGGINNLGIPNDCSTTPCQLTADQLKALKFETQSGSSIAIEGLTENNTVELTIEDSKDTTNYPKGKKYTLTSKSTNGNVTIKNAKDGDIVLEKGKGVDFREKDENLLEKVPVVQPQTTENTLGLPNDCKVDQVTSSQAQTCELTKDQLEKIKFETKDSNTSITIEGMTGDSDKVELKIEDKAEDTTNYPKGKKYTLKSTSESSVTIKNMKGGDIVLEKGKGVDFRETGTGGKLETVEDALGIPRGCTTGSSCQLTKEQFEKIKFEAKDVNTSISITDLETNDKVELKIEDKAGDTTNYPKGKKYNFKAPTGKTIKITGAKNEDIEITESGIDFKETSTGGKLEKDTASS